MKYLASAEFSARAVNDATELLEALHRAKKKHLKLHELKSAWELNVGPMKGARFGNAMQVLLACKHITFDHFGRYVVE